LKYKSENVGSLLLTIMSILAVIIIGWSINSSYRKEVNSLVSEYETKLQDQKVKFENEKNTVSPEQLSRAITHLQPRLDKDLADKIAKSITKACAGKKNKSCIDNWINIFRIWI